MVWVVGQAVSPSAISFIFNTLGFDCSGFSLGLSLPPPPRYPACRASVSRCLTAYFVSSAMVRRPSFCFGISVKTDRTPQVRRYVPRKLRFPRWESAPLLSRRGPRAPRRHLSTPLPCVSVSRRMRVVLAWRSYGFPSIPGHATIVSLLHPEGCQLLGQRYTPDRADFKGSPLMEYSLDAMIRVPGCGVN